MMSDILESAKLGRTAFVIEAINTLMSIQYRVFRVEAITETEKAQRESDKIELQKLENEILNLGYNY